MMESFINGIIILIFAGFTSAINIEHKFPHTKSIVTIDRGPSGFLETCVDSLYKVKNSKSAKTLVKQQRWQEAIWTLRTENTKEAALLENELIKRMNDAQEIITVNKLLLGENNLGKYNFKNGISGVFKLKYYQNEIITYKISKVLGINRVPITIEKTIDGRKGSFQLWVNGTKTSFDRIGEFQPFDQKREVIFFMFLISNNDFWDNPGNRMFTKDNRLLTFDNGFTYRDYGLPSSINEKYYLPSKEVLLKLRNFSDDKIQRLFEKHGFDNYTSKSFIMRKNFILNLTKKHDRT